MLRYMPNNLDREQLSSFMPTKPIDSYLQALLQAASSSPSVQTAGLTQLLSAWLNLARGQKAGAGPMQSIPTHGTHSQPSLAHSGFYILKVNIQSRSNLGLKLINPLRVHL